VSDAQIPGQLGAAQEADTIEPGQTPAAPVPPKDDDGPFFPRLLRDIATGNALIAVLAVVLALLVGAILIAATDPDVSAASVYFFSRPSDTFAAIWNSVSAAYSALFQGAIVNVNGFDFPSVIKPLTDTLSYATPLIAAGLGVALSFRVGLFNIGGQGQMLVAAGAAGWVGTSFNLPIYVLLPLALAAAIVAGAIWSGLVGLLKARTGAHEVIVTIMLNYVALYLLSYLLRTPGALQATHTSNPVSAPMKPAAIYPPILGDRFTLNVGFLFAIVATIIVWYLLNRSSLGFKFRAIGENPRAASVAGIDVKNVIVIAMLISGALVGIAGAYQVQATITTGFGSGIDANIGFDAITVALLGRSRPWGVFAAGILFGAFKAGGYAMQPLGVPIDIISVVQSLIVLFIAAPPLVRSIFRLPSARRVPRAKQARISGKKAVVTK